MKHIASVSFGKDSLAMLLRIIEEQLPLDEVVFYDTGKEFNAIYETRNKILPLLKEKNIKYTELKPTLDFDYLMFDKPVKKRGTNIIHKYGYSWCGGVCRWGTTEKLKAIEKYCKGHYEYVGIAYDEQSRLIKERKGNKLFPLADWEMTENDCLNYCYDKGYYWLEDNIRLYDILDRVSCWCCRNKNLKELKGIYFNLPKYWDKLKIIQSRLKEPMKKNYSVFDLEVKFIKESDK
jgi:3'-phosphoadenosine 5'-phosphosulfate sulfotransferase (PAPS reductase)/FAD synthetase